MLYLIKDQGWSNLPTLYFIGFEDGKEFFAPYQKAAKSFKSYEELRIYRKAMNLEELRAVLRTPKP